MTCHCHDDDDDDDISTHDILSWECQPGDVVVFHGLTLHGAK